ncbi:MAG: hypothetical protein Q8P52_00930 [bacterium]|nr:hypothetical protein [bacterium]
MTVDERVKKYITDAKNYGMESKQIRINLLSQGWTEKEIDEASNALSPSIQISATPKENEQNEPSAAEPSEKSFVSQAEKPSSDATLQKIQSKASLPSQETSAPSAAELQPSNPEKNPSEGARTRSSFGVFLGIVVAVILILAGGTLVFAHINGLWFFERAPYKANEVIIKGLSRFADFKTGKWSVSVLLKSEDREADATPFYYDKEAVEKDLEAKRAAYEYDKNLFTVLNRISNDLYNFYFLKSYYPATIAELKTSQQGKDMLEYTAYAELIDSSVVYIRKSDGKGYFLTAEFETTDAVKTVAGSYLYDEESMKISGTKVTFDEKVNSFYFFNFKGVPPRPPVIMFLEGRDKLFTYLPSEFSLRGYVSGTVDISAAESEKPKKPSGSVTIEASAKLGDSSFEVGFDARFIEDETYIRINKIPSLPIFGAQFDPSLLKGRWFKLAKKDLNDSFGVLTKVNEDPEAYENTVEAYGKIMIIFQEEKLVSVSEGPLKEKIGEKTVYKYSFRINKDKLVSSFERIANEVYPLMYDDTPRQYQDVIEFLESDMFGDFLDHMEKNNEFAIWFTKDGFPSQVRYHSRMIPIMESPKLENKQYILDFTYSIFDINQPIITEIPSEFLEFEEMMEKLIYGESAEL